jgi:hypothetical protein
MRRGGESMWQSARCYATAPTSHFKPPVTRGHDRRYNQPEYACRDVEQAFLTLLFPRDCGFTIDNFVPHVGRAER